MPRDVTGLARSRPEPRRKQPNCRYSDRSPTIACEDRRSRLWQLKISSKVHLNFALLGPRRVLKSLKNWHRKGNAIKAELKIKDKICWGPNDAISLSLVFTSSNSSNNSHPAAPLAGLALRRRSGRALKPS